MTKMTLQQRKAIAEADDEPRSMCSDATLRDRLVYARSVWIATSKEPRAMYQIDRLLDEMNRRRRRRRV